MATPKRTGRQRTQLPSCYYEGYLEKRSFKDKASRKLWTSLCGNALFFFNTNKDNDYVEKLDLCDFVSLTDDFSRDRNLDAARLNLRMKEGDIKITAPSLEARELWKGFIYSVVELSLPDSLNLLPGQIHMLREVIEKERERRQPVCPRVAEATAGPATSATPLYLPLRCYRAVSRTEAELLLERNPTRGNLVLRPGRDGASYAVTTRQDLGGPVFRHYRVTRRHEGGFAIDVENPIPCATLHDVITCLIEKTKGALTPFIMEETYEKNITFVQANEESGEKSMLCASTNSTLPLPEPIVKPAIALANEGRGETTESRPIRSVSAPPKPLPKPGPREQDLSVEVESDPEENIYLNESEAAVVNGEGVPPPLLPRLPPPRSQLSNQGAPPTIPRGSPAFVQANEDSREKSMLSATTNPTPRLPKPIMKAEGEVVDGEIVLPVPPRQPLPRLPSQANPPTVPRSTPGEQKKALKPPGSAPVAAPRNSSVSEPRDTQPRRLSALVSGPVGHILSEELKLKLQQRRATAEQ